MNTLFKFSATIIFIWIYNPYNNLYNHGSNLEKLNNVERISIIRFQRSLAKYVPKKELDRSKTKAKLLENNSYSNDKSTSDDLSKYAQLKKKGLNNLDLYKKNYKRRYSKKNVFAKFDCYCEKKIFDKFDYINELKEKLRHDKKSFNKNLNKIFDIPLILFGLFPLIGFIIPLLKIKNYEIIQGCFNDCSIKEHLKDQNDPSTHKEDLSKILINESTWNTITYVNYAFTCIAIIIVLCVVLYLLIKVIKYKKLKAGKDKMSLKEYYRFTKSLL
ncbi:hypothetical protein PVMG_05649 [Plasmodium vivax Mauritania I]|uniref:Variable surface protein Vir35 n=1 Tax=Plasmodium vivax Mauritania I TaxID=1035515 RepID=A0A0J9TH88_PLAVI|nr:hypothetical protein PVMG_05649 [Plasmodium vivax Mauritania I]